METIDKRTKEYRDRIALSSRTEAAPYNKESAEPDKKPGHFENLANNPGWKLCMYCGAELAPNEDGTPKFRRFPEPCPDCIWRNK